MLCDIKMIVFMFNEQENRIVQYFSHPDENLTGLFKSKNIQRELLSNADVSDKIQACLAQTARLSKIWFPNFLFSTKTSATTIRSKDKSSKKTTTIFLKAGLKKEALPQAPRRLRSLWSQ